MINFFHFMKVQFQNFAAVSLTVLTFLFLFFLILFLYQNQASSAYFLKECRISTFFRFFWLENVILSCLHQRAPTELKDRVHLGILNCLLEFFWGGGRILNLPLNLNKLNLFMVGIFLQFPLLLISATDIHE